MPVRAVAFSPDGAWMLTGSGDGTAKNVEYGHRAGSAAFVTDGGIIYSAALFPGWRKGVDGPVGPRKAMGRQPAETSPRVPKPPIRCARWPFPRMEQ